jgi:hypothetical protein
VVRRRDRHADAADLRDGDALANAEPNAVSDAFADPIRDAARNSDAGHLDADGDPYQLANSARHAVRDSSGDEHAACDELADADSHADANPHADTVPIADAVTHAKRGDSDAESDADAKD